MFFHRKCKTSEKKSSVQFKKQQELKTSAGNREKSTLYSKHMIFKTKKFLNCLLNVRLR